MRNKKYTLTISILASNRKDTLPKTLASLKPLMDKVSSELIVVDTGCDEDLLEIIGQYTDKIEKFEWCKDFSKARNVGIDKAQGDWFMFIDDDEWFEDVTELIEFFNSHEKDKYNYAKYLVRNYENMEGTAWSESIAGRMFRLFDETRFVDAVHERPTNIAGPTKDFTAYVHHYGYVYKSEEDRRAHIERNTSLLLEQIKREPGLVRHYCHLTQEYNVIEEYEKSLEYSYMGIKNADMSININRRDIVGLYGTVVWVLVRQCKYEEVIRKSEEYLADQYINELGKASIYGFCVVAAYKLGKYKECIDYAEKFFEMKEFFDKCPEQKYEQDAILIMLALNQSNIDRVAGIAFVAAIFAEDVEYMTKYAILYTFSAESQFIDCEKAMEKLVENMAVAQDVQPYADVAEKIVIHNGIFNILLSKVMEYKAKNYEGYFRVADVFGATGIEHGYVQYLRILSLRNTQDINSLVGYYIKAVGKISDIVEIDHEFWHIATVRGIDIGRMIEEKPLQKWIRSVDEWSMRAKVAELIQKKQDLSKVLKSESMYMRYFDMVLVEALLMRKKLDDVTAKDIETECIRYGAVVLGFYKDIYKDEVFQKYSGMLPERCQVAQLFARLTSEESKEGKLEIMAKVEQLMVQLKRICDKYSEVL